MKKRLLALILVFACALSLACAAAPVRAVETETAPAAAEELAGEYDFVRCARPVSRLLDH